MRLWGYGIGLVLSIVLSSVFCNSPLAVGQAPASIVSVPLEKGTLDLYVTPNKPFGLDGARSAVSIWCTTTVCCVSELHEVWAVKGDAFAWSDR